MHFTEYEVNLLGLILVDFKAKAVLLAGNAKVTKEAGMKDPDLVIADFMLEFDTLKEDFSNLESTNAAVLEAFLIMLEKLIPDGMAPQVEYEKHLACMGKVSKILTIKRQS